MNAFIDRQFFVHDIVRSNATNFPDRIGLIYRDREYSWREIWEVVQALARGLSAQGVVRGSCVAVLDRNSDDLIFLYHATASLGAALYPMSVLLRAPELAALIRTSKPGLLVVGADFLDLAGNSIAGLDSVPKLILRAGVRDGALGWNDIADGPLNQPCSSPQSWDDTHLLLHTSGTTGLPKSVAISHRRSVIDGFAAATPIGARPTDRYYSNTPLFHTGAWDWIKVFFMQQACVVLADRFDARQMIDETVRHGCTVLPFFPVTLRAVLDEPEFRKADFSQVRRIGYGGMDPSNVLEAGLAAFRAQGAREIGVILPYGMTEAGPFITIAQPRDSTLHPFSVGTPVPGIEIALMDDDMNEVGEGDIGEVCMRTPCLMTEYLGNPEATDEAFRGGWLHTGDLARRTSDGIYYIVDRKKDMIRTGGENVFAKEVEEVLASHPAVKECAVVGKLDARLGEIVVAAVVAEAAEADPKALRSFVRARIAGFKTPRQIHFMDELPRTPLGKVAKKELRQMLNER